MTPKLLLDYPDAKTNIDQQGTQGFNESFPENGNVTKNTFSP